MGYLLGLPKEIISLIFSYLKWRDIKRVALVCSAFKTLASTPSIWEGLFNDHYSEDPIFRHHSCERGKPEMREKRQKIDWKTLFEEYSRDRIALCSDKVFQVYFSTELECERDSNSNIVVIYLGPFANPEVASKMRIFFLKNFRLKIPPDSICDMMRPLVRNNPKLSSLLPGYEFKIFPDCYLFINLSIFLCSKLRIGYEFVPVSKRNSTCNTLIEKSMEKWSEHEKMMMEKWSEHEKMMKSLIATSFLETVNTGH